MKDEYNWYPVYTQSRSEKKTELVLKKKGIETYLPLQKTLKQWSDRKKWIEEPLFKSYIFVHISSKEYDRVLQTDGIVRFIYFSGKVCSIPYKEMNLLKNYLEGNYEPEITQEQLSKGQMVKIVSGKLKGYEAEMVTWQNTNRLIVRMEALGQSLLLKIHAKDIQLSSS